MNPRTTKPFNPLVVNPDECEELFDGDYLEEGESIVHTGEYEHISGGGRRKKPAFESDL